MAEKENRRKCFKCGASPAEDDVKLYRFSKPGTRNLLRCELWAKYMFPEGDYSSIQFQRKLYNEHRVLCERHFKPEDMSNDSMKRLAHNAVPCDVEHALAPSYSNEPSRPTERIPLSNIDVNMEPGTSGTCQSQLPKKGKMTEQEAILYKKCTKFMSRICTLQNTIKRLKANSVLKVLAEDKAVEKLSKNITPAFSLLLQGQIRNSKRKLTGKRWSKEEKIIALRIYKRSPTCYRLLRRLFCLPSASTLKNRLNKVLMDVGCNTSVLEVLKKFVKTQHPQDNEYVLMFVEMSLKKHLQYNQKDDMIEGFQDHGTQGRSEQLAGYALVFMISGIRKRVKQPVAHYFSSGFSTADRLAVLIKEVLHQCFEAGINIAATVCDMDGVNRRALYTGLQVKSM
ncbi:uncharacterized protein LOC123702543 [Colias croceus]|uniref:uncharacterized protein LOC123702543 n=1 Tax=Colias crocea TaxID=72248 RepID=UPI001E27C9A7|nr:uncharacterized protein LOC123702543 [Colias croceus]